MSKFGRFIFPSAMILIMAATLYRYNSIQDFKKKSAEHSILVEVDDIDALERVVRSATFQDVDHERVSGGYKMVLRCPPEKLGSILKIIQKSGAKRVDD